MPRITPGKHPARARAPSKEKPLSTPALSPASKQRHATSRWNPALPYNPAILIPLFYAALLFIAGILIARFQYLRPGILLAGLAPLTLIAGCAIFKAPRLSWLPIALIWITLGTWSAESERQPAPSPTITALNNGLLRTVEGTVTAAGPLRNAAPEAEDIPEAQTAPEAQNEPETQDVPAISSPHQLQQVDLELTSAETVTDQADILTAIPKSQTAKLRLTIHWPHANPDSSTPISCGDHLQAVVRMLSPDTYHDPGVWSQTDYLQSQSIAATSSLDSSKQDGNQPRLTILNHASATSIACQLNSLQQSASTRLASLPALTHALPRTLRVTPEDAAMLAALIAGDRTYLTRTLRIGFERTGSFHLVVVSGLHLAILSAFVFALARRLRIPPLPTTALTIGLTLAYALFTGFALPAQRGFWMITLYLIGRLFYRTRSPLNVIGFATLCLLAVSPRSLFDASLQMTLLSVTAIAGIALPLLDRTLRPYREATHDLPLISIDPSLPPQIAQFRVTLRILTRRLEQAISRPIARRFFPWLIRIAIQLAELIFITCIVELALSLPMAIYFHRITLYALPVNLLILPLLGLLVPAAMLLLLVLTLVAIWPAAALIPAVICAVILHLSVAIVRTLGALTLGDLRIPQPTSLQIALAVALFVLSLQLARGSTRQRSLALAAILLAAVATLYPRPIDHPANALLFQAIDVGQGDSLLLITPDGKTLLVDAGGIGFLPTTAQANFDIGEDVVSATLWSRGIRRLDAVALTHAHQDHMGGLPAILRNFRPRELWVGSNPPIPAYTALLRQALAAGTQVRSFRAGDNIPLGQASFRVLAPGRSYQPKTQPGNNDSLVLKATYRSNSILLAGDAEEPEERAMQERALQESSMQEQAAQESGLQSILLKVGHHGSITSTHPAFLAQVAPAWAVISCGRHNRFNHPRPEILAELQSAHIRTYRTDIDGTTCFELDGNPGSDSITPQPMCQTR
ncbi:ComEC/Rec2 family competence protein [Acidicapsa ligni]|uniref:ComEC/Rec2 family competence protein n=1 Tax=Acidicapsa ligni TaxID=542300 RepID=UPI0021E0414B|nr:ComEC/Rec2 family competence protein [Acidicapsa ligni]